MEGALSPATPCSLTAITGERELQLWDSQILDDPNAPPTWTNLIDQLFLDDPELEESEEALPPDGAMPDLEDLYGTPSFD